MAKLYFQQPLLQLSHYQKSNLICWFGAQETILIIIIVDNSDA